MITEPNMIFAIALLLFVHSVFPMEFTDQEVSPKIAGGITEINCNEDGVCSLWCSWVSRNAVEGKCIRSICFCQPRDRRIVRVESDAGKKNRRKDSPANIFKIAN